MMDLDDDITSLADSMWSHLWERIRDCDGCSRLRSMREMTRAALTAQPVDVQDAAAARIRPVMGVGANVRARLLFLTGKPEVREMAHDTPVRHASGRHEVNDYLLQLVARAYRDAGLARFARLEDAIEQTCDGAVDRDTWLDSLQAALLPHLHIAPVLGCAGEVSSWGACRMDVAACRRRRLTGLVYTVDPWLIVCVGSGPFAALMGLQKPPPEAADDLIALTRIKSPATGRDISYPVMRVHSVAALRSAGAEDKRGISKGVGLHADTLRVLRTALSLVDRQSDAAYHAPYIHRYTDSP